MPIERAYVASLYRVMFELLLEKCDTKSFPLNDQIQYYARIYEPKLQQLIEISAETAQLSYLKEDAYAHLEEFKTGRIPNYDEESLFLHLNVILDAPELEVISKTVYCLQKKAKGDRNGSDGRTVGGCRTVDYSTSATSRWKGTTATG